MPAARSYSACASSGVSPIAVMPTRPATASALTMWKATPTWTSSSQTRCSSPGDVEQVVGRQPPVLVRLEVVRGDVVLHAPRAGAEDARLGVVLPVGERREGDQRVARAAVPQVDLDGVRGPASVLAHGDEVDREAADHARVAQVLGDRATVPADLHGVPGVGRKPAADVDLPARAAEDLVVGREHLDLAVGTHAYLHARAAEVLAGDPLLGDRAALGDELVELVGGDARVLERDRARGRLTAGAERDDAVPEPAHAVVELDDHLPARWPAGADLLDRPDHVAQPAKLLEAQRQRHTDVGEEMPAARLGAEAREVRVGAVDGDAELHGEPALQLGDDERQDRGAPGRRSAA